MDKRFVIFLLLSFTILFGYMSLQSYLQRNDKDNVVEQADDGKTESAAEGKTVKPAPEKTKQPEKIKPPPKKEVKPPPKVVVAAQVPHQYVTIGGFVRYRMVVTLDSQGAAVVRLELSDEKYRDLHDKSGYLGHLGLEKDAAQCRVNIVGAGTPAAEAGLKVGDEITEIDEQPLDVQTDAGRLIGSEAFHHRMAETKPGDEIKLTVVRSGKDQPLTLTATLWRRPLEVIRPEAENYAARDEPLPDEFEESPSLLLGLVKNVAGSEQPVEFASDKLRKGNWEVGALSSDGEIWNAGEQSEDRVTFRQQLPDEGLIVYKTFSLERVPDERLDDEDESDKKFEIRKLRSYHVTLSVRIKNVGSEETSVGYVLDGPNGLPTEGWWYAYKISPNWFWESGGGGGLRDYVYDLRVEKPQLIGCTTVVDQTEDGELEVKKDTPVEYLGVDAQYFSAILFPAGESKEVEFAKVVYRVVGEINEDQKNLSNISFQLTRMRTIPPGESVSDEFELFAGPRQPDLMKAYDVDHIIEYGMFSWVATAMLWLLHQFYSVVGNYGVSIFILTVLVRGCMFPISRKQALSARKMQELAPEIKKIQEKYGKDMEKRMKAQRELWAKHKVNPLAGCLPVFMQLPIFIGLYRSLSVDIELRDASLLGKSIRWCSNLAAPGRFLDWTAWMPDFITQGHGMFVPGPFLNILPIIVITTWIIQQKMFMPPPTDDQQAMQQKMMKFMMIFMGLMFFKVAAGLCLYFIASSTWSICERKMLPKAKAPPVKSEDKTDPLVERREARKTDTKASSNGNAQARKKKRKNQGRK